MNHKCRYCGLSFKQNPHRLPHERNSHADDQSVRCVFCEQIFQETTDLHHVDNVHRDGTFSCSTYFKTFSVKGHFQVHQKHCTSRPTSQPGPSRQFRCRRCTQSFDDRRQLYLHAMRHHFQTGEGVGLHNPTWEENSAPWSESHDSKLKVTHESNAAIILEIDREGSVHSVYNLPLINAFTIPQLMTRAQDIYERQQDAFRLNLEFGLILKHTETGEYRYFKPVSNETLFQRPIYVSRRQDINRLKLRLQHFNVTDFILRQRPNTQWKLYLITNVRFCLHHLNYTLGRGGVKLPDYIKNSRSIVSLDKDSRKRLYKDHLCVFRCLAVHRGRLEDHLETHTKTLFSRWIDYLSVKDRDIDPDPKNFRGVQLTDIPDFEKCFDINVNINQLRDDDVALPIFKSICRYKDTLHLNLFENHLSYIKNLTGYTNKYQCATCDRHFPRPDNMKRHQKICKGQTKYRFPGGFY